MFTSNLKLSRNRHSHTSHPFRFSKHSLLYNVRLQNLGEVEDPTIINTGRARCRKPTNIGLLHKKFSTRVNPAESFVPNALIYLVVPKHALLPNEIIDLGDVINSLLNPKNASRPRTGQKRTYPISTSI
jgi:hypothetical protein